MDPAKPAPTMWSSAQAYAMAVVCLLLGLIAGYFMRGSRPAPSAASSSAPTQTAQPVPDAGNMQVSPEALKHMADKQAEPLLARLEKSPNDPSLLADLGKTYLAAQQFQTAVGYYERSVKIKPSADILNTLGGAYHFAKEDDKALDAWQRALAIEPTNPDALFNVGMVKWQVQGDPQAAIASWTKLVKTNPNHPQRKRVEELIARAKQHANRPAASPVPKP